MEINESTRASEYAGAIGEIARVAEAGELDGERLGAILSQRYGAVNCYPGEPTDTCYPLAWFIALEGRLGRGLQQDYGHPWRRYWWHHGPLVDWGHAPQPPYGFAAMLETLVRHLQGHCAGTTRQAILLTDSWNALAYERWRGNLERIRAQVRLEIHLLGAGGWQQRLF